MSYLRGFDVRSVVREQGRGKVGRGADAEDMS